MKTEKSSKKVFVSNTKKDHSVKASDVTKTRVKTPTFTQKTPIVEKTKKLTEQRSSPNLKNLNIFEQKYRSDEETDRLPCSVSNQNYGQCIHEQNTHHYNCERKSSYCNSKISNQCSHCYNSHGATPMRTLNPIVTPVTPKAMVLPQGSYYGPPVYGNPVTQSYVPVQPVYSSQVTFMPPTFRPETAIPQQLVYSTLWNNGQARSVIGPTEIQYQPVYNGHVVYGQPPESYDNFYGEKYEKQQSQYGSRKSSLRNRKSSINRKDIEKIRKNLGQMAKELNIYKKKEKSPQQDKEKTHLDEVAQFRRGHAVTFDTTKNQYNNFHSEIDNIIAKLESMDVKTKNRPYDTPNFMQAKAEIPNQHEATPKNNSFLKTAMKSYVSPMNQKSSMLSPSNLYSNYQDTLLDLVGDFEREKAIRKDHLAPLTEGKLNFMKKKNNAYDDQIKNNNASKISPFEDKLKTSIFDSENDRMPFSRAHSENEQETYERFKKLTVEKMKAKNDGMYQNLFLQSLI